MLPLFFRLFTQVHLLIDGSVEGQYITGGGDQFGTGYQVINNCVFISEGAFTFKVEGTGIIIRGFFVSKGSEVIIIVGINENI